MNKPSKSILKINKGTKTVRIMEPNGMYDNELDDVVQDIPTISVSEAGYHSESKPNEYVGYLNPAFEDLREDEENLSADIGSNIVKGETYVKSILTDSSATKIFVTKLEVANINHLEENYGIDKRNANNIQKRVSIYENVDVAEHDNVIIEEPEESNYENDTFHLAKDSVLFSQVSRSIVLPSSSFTVNDRKEENKCKVVEVKAGEIFKSIVTAVESTEHVVLPQTTDHFEPQTVEIVEIIEDTETEPEESAPDTDPEDKMLSSKCNTEYTEIEQMFPKQPCIAVDSESTVAQKLNNDLNESKSVSDKLNIDSIGPVRMLKETSGSKSCFEEFQSSFDSAIPCIKSDIPSPLCLQMTDRVNRMEQTTVTTWKDDDDFKNEKEILVSTKEVTLRKEIEVSKTYQIIGNFTNNLTDQKNMLTVPSAVEDDDSFYGSDKETDDVIIFSEDEGHIEPVNDSSSSDDEIHDSLLYEHDALGYKVGFLKYYYF